MTLDQLLKSNPWMTYGYAVGYISGQAAAYRDAPFSGLSAEEWRHDADDYAAGYRAGYREENGTPRTMEHV